MNELLRRYTTVDVRLLGVFRLYLGLVLLVDLWRRVPLARFFYSDDGVYPASFAAVSPLDPPEFSLFMPFGSMGGLAFAFAITTAAYGALLVGYRTRIAQIASFLLYTSLNARNVFLENTGAITMGLLLAWTLPLPVGRCYSMDARHQPRLGTTRDPYLVTSPAMVGITLQIAAIYLFNALHKNGETWLRGDAFHWVLWQNRIATSVAGWLRLHEPGFLSPLASWGTLVVEGIMPLLVLSPWRQRPLRNLHVALALGLHLSIALLFSLGVFSYVMIALNLLMLPAETVDTLIARAGPKVRALLGARFVAFAEGPKRKRRVEPSVTEQQVWIVLTIWMTVIAGIQLTHDNWIVPERFRLKQPRVTAWWVDAFRQRQAWSLFAPEAPRTDGRIVVDAVTADGRHLDPFTGAPPDFTPGQRGPWGIGQPHCEYFFHLRRPELARHRPQLARTFERWHLFEGRPARDRLVSYEIFWVGHDAPPPGSVTPGPDVAELLLAGP